MHCRKNFVDLTDDERDRLADALNQLHDDGVIEESGILKGETE